MILLPRLVPLMTVCALFLGTPAAHAEEDVYGDPAGDLVVLDGQKPAPEVPNGDITSVTTNHGPKVLTLATTFVERTDEFVGWKVVTPKHRFFVGLYIFGLPQPGAGNLEIRRGNKSVGCPHAYRIELPASSQTIKVRVPRKCLGKPRWVRIGSIASDTVGDIQYADDARQVGTINQFKIPVGPRVKAG